MKKIAILSPSVRIGRNSHRIANYLERIVRENDMAKIEILDLLQYNFPLFNERLKFQAKPLKRAVTFAKKVQSADGIIIISPEYNGGSPASLKNAVDLLVEEWHKKPVAFVTVSDGSFAGTQAIISLQFSLSKLGAIIVPPVMRLPNINTTFDENGVPLTDKERKDKRSIAFINELLWCIEAKGKMS